MSYYTMAVEFWGEVALSLGGAAILAASVDSAKRWMTRSFARVLDDVPAHSHRTGPASC